MDKSMPKDTIKSIANVNRLNNQTNDAKRDADYNHHRRNKNAYEVKSMLNNGQDFIEASSQPARRYKRRFTQIAENRVAKTGKPYCYDGGLINPVKFNLSNDTLNKLKGS